MTDAGTGAASGTTNDNARSRRARQALAGILVVLVLLLLATTYFLLSILRPVGEFASSEETGGLEWVRSIYGWGNGPNEQLKAPNGVAVAPDGTIWVTDQTRAQVIGFNPDGSYAGVLEQGPRASSDEALSFPTSLAVDEDGIVYIGDPPRDRVVAINEDNEIVRQYTVPQPASIAVRGDRLVVGARAGFVILDKEGTVIELVGTQGQGDDQFDRVGGVAIDQDGTIYAIDTYNNRVSAYDRDGNRLWIVRTGAPGNEVTLQGGGSQVSTVTAEAAMQLPVRAAIDGNGRLVIADPFDFGVTVLDPSDGSLIAKYGGPGASEGLFTYPGDVAYDSVHDWFAIADTSNNRVQIVRIPDSGGAALSPVSRALTGPLRACALPLLLLLIAAIIWATNRRRKKKLARTSAGERAASGNG